MKNWEPPNSWLLKTRNAISSIHTCFGWSERSSVSAITHLQKRTELIWFVDRNSGEMPPWRPRNFPFTSAPSGKQSKDSIIAMKTVLSYLCSHLSALINTFVCKLRKKQFLSRLVQKSMLKSWSGRPFFKLFAILLWAQLLDKRKKKLKRFFQFSIRNKYSKCTPLSLLDNSNYTFFL